MNRESPEVIEVDNKKNSKQVLAMPLESKKTDKNLIHAEHESFLLWKINCSFTYNNDDNCKAHQFIYYCRRFFLTTRMNMCVQVEKIKTLLSPIKMTNDF